MPAGILSRVKAEGGCGTQGLFKVAPHKVGSRKPLKSFKRKLVENIQKNRKSEEPCRVVRLCHLPKS